MTPAHRRIALYSHDTVGLGHTRRNLALAGAIVAADPGADVIMITGNPESLLLPIPPRTDIVTLPTITKGADGYVPRVLGAGLEEVLALRREVITGTLRGFAPDLLIVDKVPGGVGGELLPALEMLRTHEATRTVLGLREILDAPAVVRREWRQSGNAELIKEHYDAIWVYGDPTVIDPAAEYGWGSEISTKITHTGYLSRRWTPAAADRSMISPPEQPYVLCQVGGGQDGHQLAETFVRTPMPTGHRGVLLTGPYLPADRRQRLQQLAGPTIDILGFVGNAEEFLHRSAAVVSMAGYNSACEVLASDVPALLVPRITPRTEQLIRAERLADLDCLDLLHPDLLGPHRLHSWLNDAIGTPPPAGRQRLDLDGLDRIGELAVRLIEGARDAA